MDLYQNIALMGIYMDLYENIALIGIYMIYMKILL